MSDRIEHLATIGWHKRTKKQNRRVVRALVQNYRQRVREAQGQLDRMLTTGFDMKPLVRAGYIQEARGILARVRGQHKEYKHLLGTF